MPIGIATSIDSENPTPTRQRLAIVSCHSSPDRPIRSAAIQTKPGDGKNFGSIEANCVTSHQTNSGMAIEAIVKLKLKD